MKNRIRLVPAILFLAGILILCPAYSFAQSRTIKLNETAFAYAEELVAQGRAVIDKKNAWKHHRPMAEDENEFIRAHGFAQYSKWHLGIDETHAEGTKARYKFSVRGFQECSPLRSARGEKQSTSVRLCRHRKGSYPANRDY